MRVVCVWPSAEGQEVQACITSRREQAIAVPTNLEKTTGGVVRDHCLLFVQFGLKTVFGHIASDADAA